MPKDASRFPNVAALERAVESNDLAEMARIIFQDKGGHEWLIRAIERGPSKKLDRPYGSRHGGKVLLRDSPGLIPYI